MPRDFYQVQIVKSSWYGLNHLCVLDEWWQKWCLHEGLVTDLPVLQSQPVPPTPPLHPYTPTAAVSHSTLVDWLSGSLLNRAIQLKSCASLLLAGGETDLSVHAWIHYFCCCYYPWQGYGIWDPRPVGFLASVLLLSPPHNKVVLNVSCEWLLLG